jgi:hypothetical protein
MPNGKPGLGGGTPEYIDTACRMSPRRLLDKPWSDVRADSGT